MRSLAKQLPADIGDHFYYDETSPSGLRWKIDRYVLVCGGPGLRKVVSAGDVAGHLRKDGYWSVKYFSDSLKNHRIVYALHNPDVSIESVIFDHVNGNNSDNKISNIIPSTDELNGKNKAKYSSNTTGVTGIHINEKQPGKFCYVASWRELNHKIGAKSFSMDKYGKEGAFRMACEYREAVMTRLKTEGATYTERHGK
jgi:hypothetical protein